MVTCHICGVKVRSMASMKRTMNGSQCKSESACFHRLSKQAKEMRAVGAQMSNLCFNLSKMPGSPLTRDHCELMRGLYDKWVIARRPA